MDIEKIYYNNLDKKIEIIKDNDTIWLNTKMLAELYGLSSFSINKLISELYDTGKLNKFMTSKIFIQDIDGSKKRDVVYYNLEVVLELAYKLNSKNAIGFRNWLTQNHLQEDKQIDKKHNKRSSKYYYVAYLDILGTKEHIANDENDIYLNNLNSIYQDAIIQIKKTKKEYKDKDFFIKIFSDNILISMPLIENKFNKEKLELLINLTGCIQVNALRYGYLLRGAITKGEFYKNDIFVHGKALVNAVVLEEKNAIYPRIIIDRAEIYNTNKLYLYNDIDDFYYVNYYYFSEVNNFSLFKSTLLRLLNNSRQNNKVKQKIMWTINYHNKYFKDKLNSHQDKIKPIILQEEIIKYTKMEVADNDL